MADLVGRPSTVTLLEQAIAGSDRVLVLGAGGWFGRTVLELLLPRVGVRQCLSVTSRPRPLLVRSRTIQAIAWDPQLVAEFSPTLVVNLAFHTRHHQLEMGEDEYWRANEKLLDRYVQSATLPSVRSVVTVSSGAVAQGPEDAYCLLKRKEESLTADLVSPARTALIARAFSVSGPWVRRPHDYAFSDMILQAAAGDITVRAQRPTYRRYVDAADYLAVALILAMRGQSGVLESGGDLIEMRDLAKAIAAEVNPTAYLHYSAWDVDLPDLYSSDGKSWTAALASLGLSAMALRDQIRAVARALLDQSDDGDTT